VDWGVVTQYYATDFANLGGQIIYNFKVKSFEECKHNRALKIISKKNVLLLYNNTQKYRGTWRGMC